MPEPILIERDDPQWNDPGATFEPHRGHLRGLAYRMLGSMSEADDVAQDAYLRWHKIGGKARGQIENPRAWLSKATTRLCLDRLKSARAQRETYVGPWLPEPVIEPEAARDPAEVAQDLTVAFLLLLERLSPLERAAFLLHDVFEMSFGQVSEILRRDPAACRQLATRARKHIDAGRPRFDATSEDQQRIAAAFLEAAGSGDPARLAHLLAEDAALISDGGGKVLAALNPILGRDKVMAFVFGVREKHPFPDGTEYRPSIINGLPGFVIVRPGDIVDQTLSFEIKDGVIQRIYAVRNPDKLRSIQTQCLPLPARWAIAFLQESHEDTLPRNGGGKGWGQRAKTSAGRDAASPSLTLPRSGGGILDQRATISAGHPALRLPATYSSIKSK